LEAPLYNLAGSPEGPHERFHFIKNAEDTLKTRGCVSCTVALPFTLKSIILRQKKKNYETQIIFSPCKNYIIIFQKIL
jgi:hypothetical protein